MREPDGNVVAAAKFMPVVEKLGMIRPVDRTALRLAVEELEAHPAVKIAINVSGLTTSDRSWLRSATALLRGRNGLAERLIVEITETAGLDDMDACARFVTTLRELGCRVALDDFGAGYTSFRHLKQLAVNIVKIDGSFVRNIRSTPDNLVFVRTLIDLARTFDLETVAECVETMDEADILTAEGVNYLQGYAFGKPELARPWLAADSEVKATGDKHPRAKRG
jgi:EAL domain-containing protein (putative c-di-GMP-specific phosphodiesterase class I)